MIKQKLLALLFIICTNALPFIWHKNVWKSLRDVCLAYCAISSQTQKCIWGKCVEPLTKQCTPFFKQIQAKPLKKLGSGSYHTVHTIEGTNLVSKALDIKNQSDFEFLTETIHRLRNIEGIHLPLCVMKNGANEYNVISERVIELSYWISFPFITQSYLVEKYHKRVESVYGALQVWLLANGIHVWDFSRNGHLSHNLALSLKGEPIFFDLDNVRFGEVQTKEVERARQRLNSMKNRQWNEFINEVAKEKKLPKFIEFSLGTEKCIWGKCVDPSSKKCTPSFQHIQSKPLQELGSFKQMSGHDYTAFAIQGTNLVSKSLRTFHHCFIEKECCLYEQSVEDCFQKIYPNIEGIDLPICVTKNEADEYTVTSEKVIFLDDDKFRPIIDSHEDIVNEVYSALKSWLKANGVVVNFYSDDMSFNSVTFAGEPIFSHPNFHKIQITYFHHAYVLYRNLFEAKSQEIVNDAKEKLKILKGDPRWKKFTNAIAREKGLPPFHKSSDLKAVDVAFPMKLVVCAAQLLAFIILFFRLRP